MTTEPPMSNPLQQKLAAGHTAKLMSLRLSHHIDVVQMLKVVAKVERLMLAVLMLMAKAVAGLAGAGGAMVAHLMPADTLRIIMPVVLVAVAQESLPITLTPERSQLL